MKCKIVFVMFLTFMTFMTLSCSQDGIYLSTHSNECLYTSNSDCTDSSLQIANIGEHTEYRIGFIEYDDQGQLRDRKQQESVINNYLSIAGKQDVILITFVHGWHHSAKPGDTNVDEFRNILADISRNEAKNSASHQRDRRPVLGVYLGWRGKSIDIKYLNMISFWDRKNTARKVGEQGVTEALLKLEELVNVRKAIQDGSPPSTSRLVVLGHSFGGEIMYSSLKKIMADRFIDSRKSKSEASLVVDGFGDLVVLINPAFEALRFSALWELSQDGCRSYSVGQLPKLAILTSETDYATKIAFPLGRTFSTLFQRHSTMQRYECQSAGELGKKPVEIAQGKANRNTIGHFEEYKTHRLEKTSNCKTTHFDLQRAYSYWSGSATTDDNVFSSACLTSNGRTTLRNPYMNIEVAKNLMDGHNDIWGTEVIQFIQELIILSTTPDEVYKNMQKIQMIPEA